MRISFRQPHYARDFFNNYPDFDLRASGFEDDVFVIHGEIMSRSENIRVTPVIPPVLIKPQPPRRKNEKPAKAAHKATKARRNSKHD